MTDDPTSWRKLTQTPIQIPEDHGVDHGVGTPTERLGFLGDPGVGNWH
jgi:hypothetical protein